MRLFAAILALVTAALATSCGAAKIQRTYPGPELPDAEVSRLSAKSRSAFWVFYARWDESVILSVDGQRGEPGTQLWALLPGRHTVETAYVYGHFFFVGRTVRRSPAKTLEFDSLPGGHYAVDGRFVRLTPDHAEYCPWIQEEGSGQLVAGSRDPAPAAD